MKKNMFLLLTIISFILISIAISFPEIKAFNYNEINTVMKKHDCEIEKIDLKYKRIEFYKTKGNKCNYDITFIKSKDKGFIINRYKELIDEVYKNEEVTGVTNINILSRYREKATNGIYYKTVKLNNDTVFYLSTDRQNRETALMIEKEIGFYYEPNWGMLILFILPLVFYNKYEECKNHKYREL